MAVGFFNVADIPLGNYTSTPPTGWLRTLRMAGWELTVSDIGGGERQASLRAVSGLTPVASPSGNDMESVVLAIVDSKSGISGRGHGGAGVRQKEEFGYDCTLTSPNSLQIRRLSETSGGTQFSTTLATVGFSFSAGNRYWIRCQVVGSTIRGKAWLDGAAEPGWLVTVTDDSPEAVDSGRPGMGFTGALFRSIYLVMGFSDDPLVKVAPTAPFPDQPTLTITDITGVSATLVGSAYSGAFAHGASRWQMQEAGGDWSDPVFDSDWDAVNLLSISINPPLVVATDYEARLAYQDVNDGESEWSDVVAFTTLEHPFVGASSAPATVYSGCDPAPATNWEECD